MKRLMSNNVCFNFFTDPDIISVNDAICDYDVYIIFAECYSSVALTSKINDAEKLVYGIVSSKTYTNKEVKEEIIACLDKLYFDQDPVIDVIIKKREFFVKRLSMEG